MPNTSTLMIRAATTALPSWNAPLLDLCLLLCLCPMAWPFRRTPLALHCTEGSSRGACAIPLGGCRLYSPECREGFFSESGFPINGVLGNRASDNRHSRKLGSMKRAGAQKAQPTRACEQQHSLAGLAYSS